MVDGRGSSIWQKCKKISRYVLISNWKTPDGKETRFDIVHRARLERIELTEEEAKAVRDYLNEILPKEV